MAAPDRSAQAGENYVHTLAAAAAAVTMDLPAPPSAGLAWVIDQILCYALGTVTAFNVDVQSAAAASYCKVGGQVGGVTLGALDPFKSIAGPIPGLANNQTKIILTATGATAVQVTTLCHLAPA